MTTISAAETLLLAAASVKKSPKHLPARNSDFYGRIDRREKGDRQESVQVHNAARRFCPPKNR
jgi:hypothetical protein